MVEATKKFDGFKGSGIRERPVVILGGNRDDHRQYKREDALPVCDVSCEPCYEPFQFENGRVACLLQREATRAEQRTNERREVHVRGMRFCEIERERGNPWWS